MAPLMTGHHSFLRYGHSVRCNSAISIWESILLYSLNLMPFRVSPPSPPSQTHCLTKPGWQALESCGRPASCTAFHTSQGPEELSPWQWADRMLSFVGSQSPRAQSQGLGEEVHSSNLNQFPAFTVSRHWIPPTAILFFLFGWCLLA